MITFLIFGFLIVFVLWFIASFNGLVRGNNRVKEAWSDIEVQLKRRYDLVPNLVELVKKYAAHEKEIFEKISQARTQAMGAVGEKNKLQSENQFSQTLKTLFAVAENYPNLKADQNFRELQSELVDTEDKILAARRFYNSVVRDYNISIQTFPGNLVANFFKFGQHELFDIDDNGPESKPVKVEL